MSERIRSSTQPISIDVSRYDSYTGTLTADLITLPLDTGQNKFVLMQVLKHKLDTELQQFQNKPPWSFVIVNGGTSGALESAGTIKRAVDAIKTKTSESQNPFFIIDTVMSISHPQGAVREQAIVDETDLVQSAQLIERTLLDPKITKADTEGFILWGFSAGAGVLIEVASLLQKKGKKYKLVLVEPAATSKHDNFLRKIAINGNFDIFEYFRLQDEKAIKDTRRKGDKEKGQTFFAVFDATMKEMGYSMTTPAGVPSMMGLLQESFGGGQARLRKIAQDHGLEKIKGGSAPNLALLDHDVTYKARQELNGEIILISAVFAKTVNLLTSRGELNDNILHALWGYYVTHEPIYNQKLFESLQQKYPQLSSRQIWRKIQQLTQNGYFDSELSRIAEQLFPKAQVKTLPIFTGLHSGTIRVPNLYQSIFNLLNLF